MIFQHIDEPGYTNDLACYVKHGGYEVMKRASRASPRS
jgi:NADH-quinone oxidoreductase subunit F